MNIFRGIHDKEQKLEKEEEIKKKKYHQFVYEKLILLFVTESDFKDQAQIKFV